MNRLAPRLVWPSEIGRSATDDSPRLAGSLPLIGLADGNQLRLRGLFGLTRAQARLALLLFDGKSVKEAAADLGITEGSARQYLKQVFRKTGARRQADLVRIMIRALPELN